MTDWAELGYVGDEFCRPGASANDAMNDADRVELEQVSVALERAFRCDAGLDDES